MSPENAILRKENDEVEMYVDILAHSVGNISQTLLGNISLLLEMHFGELNEEQKEILDVCRKQVLRMYSFVEKAKILRQINASSSNDFKTIDLDAVLKILVVAAKSITSEKNIRIEYHQAEAYPVKANRLIYHLFLNLFENSVKHTSASEIVINIRIDQTTKGTVSFWKISIEDNGPGIRDSVKAYLFKRFEKGHDNKGSGVGLAVVRALTEKYGGQVSVEDRVKGDFSKGTRFVVLLPVAEDS